jgi:tricorn protease
MPASGSAPARPYRDFRLSGLRPMLATAFLLFLAMPAGPLQADPIRFMRDPHVAGDNLVFSYQGDIWLTAHDGSNPRRLTTHPAREVAPRFSPDGRWIAFSSDRMGNYDVFVVSVDGGEARQLTWHSGDDMVQYWTPDGTGILIATARAAHPFGSPLYIVPLDGGVPVPLEIDFGRAGMIRQDGAMLAFNRNAMSTTRKGYRGNNSTDVWVQDLRSREIRRLTDTDLQRFREFTHDGMPMWGADGRIYFASERGGTYNLWRIAAGGGEPEPFTRHERGGVKYPAASPDGRTIVYTNDHELWMVDVPDGTPRRIPVDLSFDPSDNRTEYVAVENRAEGWALSPDAKHVAVDARGEILLVPVDPETGEMRRIGARQSTSRFTVELDRSERVDFAFTDRAPSGSRSSRRAGAS